MVRAATAPAAGGALTARPPHGKLCGEPSATAAIEIMRKRTNQQRQREMAARARSRELASRRRRERRGVEMPAGHWVVLRVAGSDEETLR